LEYSSKTNANKGKQLSIACPDHREVGLQFQECSSKTPYMPKQLNPSGPVLLYIIKGHLADFVGAGDLFRFGGDVPGKNAAILQPGCRPQRFG
jgi:hypothetical protein